MHEQLANRTKQGLRRELAINGFAVIRELDIGRSAAEVARSLGTVSPIPGRRLVEELTPRPASHRHQNTYSGAFGLGQFPLHTDLAHWALPPRYLMLRCSVGASNTQTRILDTRPAAAQLPDLARVLLLPRRSLGGPRVLLHLLQRVNTETIFRWDPLFTVAATVLGKRAIAAVSDWFARQEPHELSLSSGGDTMIIDNWRMIHGRSSVAPEAMGRCLHRVYLAGIQ